MNNLLGFSKQAIASLVCQIDGLPLAVKFVDCGSDEVITDGCLLCPLGHDYEIKSGILNLLRSQPPLNELVLTEKVARDNFAGSYDSKLFSRYDKEIPSTLNNVGNLRGKRCVEYGCGTGRITSHLTDAKVLVAVDFSVESLRILSAKLKGRINIGLVVADVAHLKTRANFFNVAVSAQVFEHLPTAKLRQEFLGNVSKTLITGGWLVLTAYYFDLRRRLGGRPQEGKHRSGIFYHYFTQAEIIEEFSRQLKIEKLKPIDITLPLESRLGLNKLCGGVISRLAERIPGLRNLGHLILVKAVK